MCYNEICIHYNRILDLYVHIFPYVITVYVNIKQDWHYRGTFVIDFYYFLAMVVVME